MFHTLPILFKNSYLMALQNTFKHLLWQSKRGALLLLMDRFLETILFTTTLTYNASLTTGMEGVGENKLHLTILEYLIPNSSREHCQKQGINLITDLPHTRNGKPTWVNATPPLNGALRSKHFIRSS